jgi:cell division septum initiation protein DivIVA
MEREQIVRDDFPSARKGWSPEAVRAHLIAVAAAFPEPQADVSPAADAASERVQAVIAAAEVAAAEIVSEAQAEAERIRAAARAESEQTVTAANREATGRVEQARGAVEGLIAQADKLRAQVGALGRDLASNVPGSGVSAAAAAAEGPSDRAATDPPEEAAPPPPDPPAAEPLVVPEAAPEPIRKPAESPSNEDLISQLRGAMGSTGAAVEEEAPTGPPAAPSGSDQGAARLVAMNMALDGSSRDQITARIAAEFSTVGNAETLVDDVLRRAAR